jgi:uncharacterized membrane protein required for colicin V production
MMTLPHVFWLFVIVFGVVGSFRGWAKEILVCFSLLLAIAIDRLLFTYVREVQLLLAPTGEPNLTQFSLRAGLLLVLAFFGYQTPNLQAFMGKVAKEKIQDWLLGLLLGMLNGYFMVGSLWYYMDVAQYPLTPFVMPPPDQAAFVASTTYLAYMPPMLLGVPQIYFAIIGAFVFVIIVFI